MAFSTSTLSGTVTGISIGEESIPVLDETGLSTTDFREKCFGDLSEPPQVTVSLDFSATDAFIALGTVETMTITFPMYPGDSTSEATYAGTGAVISRKLPDLAPDEKQVASVTFQFDGKTGPTFTAGT